MDPFSVAVGFVMGAFTGAAGNYLADKFTDSRREKRVARQLAHQWKGIEQKHPALIAEMRDDFSKPEGRNVRAFFVKSSKTLLAGTSEPCFEYHTDKHADLRAAILRLQECGYVTDITPGDTPMYRVHEALVDRLVRKP